MKNKKIVVKFNIEDLTIKWEYDDMQACTNTVLVKDKKEILYYYYTLTVIKNNEELFNVYVYDFPAIICFFKILKDIVSDTDFENRNWSKYVIDEYNFSIYQQSMEAHGSLLVDDAYEFKRTVYIDDDGEISNEHFQVFVGYGLKNTVPGVYIQLSRKQVEQLINTIELFLQQSIDEHNRRVKKRIAFNANIIEASDEGLLKFYKTPKKKRLDDIYVTGDEVDLDVFLNDTHDTYMKYRQCQIQKITKATLTVNTYSGKTEDIPIDRIYYINIHDMSEERLKYDKTACMEDFLAIMTPSMKKEFIEQPEDDIAEKWKWALISRTWMCRGEHKFNNPQKTAKKIIKQIIKNLKKEKQ